MPCATDKSWIKTYGKLPWWRGPADFRRKLARSVESSTAIETGRTKAYFNPNHALAGSGSKEQTFSAGSRSFGSTQLDLPNDLQVKCRAWVMAHVAKEDLSPLEAQDDAFHITVRYGLHSDEPRDVAAALSGLGPATVTLGRVEQFEAEEYDVLVVPVAGEIGLVALRAALAGLPHTDTFSNYKPHVTLAYVQKKAGRRHLGDASFLGDRVTLDRLRFSDTKHVVSWVSLLPVKTFEWNEEDHPRVEAGSSEGGQFGPGGGGQIDDVGKDAGSSDKKGKLQGREFLDNLSPEEYRAFEAHPEIGMLKPDVARYWVWNSWVDGPHSGTSLALQSAVGKFIGLSMDQSPLQKLSKASNAQFVKVVQDEYAKTQAHFQKKGVSTVTLFRAEEVPKPGAVVKTLPTAFQSWSSDKRVAEYFVSDLMTNGTIRTETFPVSRILASGASNRLLSYPTQAFWRARRRVIRIEVRPGILLVLAKAPKYPVKTFKHVATSDLMGLSRDLTAHERKVDFAAIDSATKTLTAQGRDRVRAILSAAKGKLLTLVASRHDAGKLTTKFILDLELRGLGDLVPTLRGILSEGFRVGQREAKKELKAGKSYAEWEESLHPRVEAGSSEGGQFAPGGGGGGKAEGSGDKLSFGSWGARLTNDEIIGYRAGGSVGENLGKIAATEGVGPYIAKQRGLASEFGTVQRVSFLEPKNPMVVDEEPLYMLHELPEIMRPPSSGDSPWLTANKAAVRLSKTTDKTWGRNMESGRLPDALNTVLRKAGHDAVLVRSGGDEWVVLLPAEKGGKVALRSYELDGTPHPAPVLFGPASVRVLIQKLVTRYPDWTKDQIKVAVQRGLKRARGPRIAGGGSDYAQVYFNPNRVPAGSPEGGQFAPGDTSGDGGDTSQSSGSNGSQIGSSQFKAWFGESKVVGSDSKPLVVYHGTWSDFPVFDRLQKVGERIGLKLDTVGSWFTTDANSAGQYGPSIVPVYLSIKKPLIFTGGGEAQVATKAFRRAVELEGGVEKFRLAAQAEGYDGVAILGDRLDHLVGDIYVAFHPTQIKSAIGNTGSFDPKNPNITLSNRQQARSYAVTLDPTGLPPEYALQFFERKAILWGADIRQPLLGDIKNILFDGIKRGSGMRDLQSALELAFLPWLGNLDQMVNDLTLTPYRLETLVRTNIIEALNEGRKAQFQPSVDDGFIIGLLFSAVLDVRTTEVCNFLDGKIFPPNSPDTDRLSAPRHFNCFVNPTAKFYTSTGWKTWTDLRVGDEVLTHRGRFRKVTEKMIQPAERVEVVRVWLAADQPRGGKPFRTFCVTPEHPVLAGERWVLAGGLRKGDSIALSAKPCRKCGKPAPWFRQSCEQRCAGALHKVTADMKRRLSADMRRQYTDGRRDRFETTKEANVATRRLVKQGRWVLQDPEVRKLGMIAQTKRNYGKTWLESKLGWALVQAGLRPRKQYAVARNGSTKQGHPRYVFPDFAFPGRKVAVEADGWRHRTEEGIAADKKRDAELRELGWTVLRFPEAAIKADLRGCAAQVSRVLANHDGEYSNISVQVAKVERYFVHAPRYNFAVEEDESYVGPAGVVMHNCRSIWVPVTRLEGPVQYITSTQVAKGIDLSGSGFACDGHSHGYEWDESLHPRNESGSPEGGQFAPGEGAPQNADAIRSEGGGKDRAFVNADGTSVNAATMERIHALGLPPAWTNLRVSADPDSPLQAIGEDASGKDQYRYSKEKTGESAAAKFSRVGDLAKDGYRKMEAGVARDMAKGVEEAVVMRLALKSAMRNGGESKLAYGATTLEARHLSVKGDVVAFDFPGKSGKQWQGSVRDTGLAKAISARLAGKKGTDKVFVTRASKVNAYLKQFGQMSAKDIRTLQGTAVAIKTLKSFGIPSSLKEAKLFVRNTAKVVSDHLRNTPAVALRSYIDPVIWAPMQAKFGFQVVK